MGAARRRAIVSSGPRSRGSQLFRGSARRSPSAGSESVPRAFASSPSRRTSLSGRRHTVVAVEHPDTRARRPGDTSRPHRVAARAVATALRGAQSMTVMRAPGDRRSPRAGHSSAAEAPGRSSPRSAFAAGRAPRSAVLGAATTYRPLTMPSTSPTSTSEPFSPWRTRSVAWPTRVETSGTPSPSTRAPPGPAFVARRDEAEVDRRVRGRDGVGAGRSMAGGERPAARASSRT